MGQIVDATMPKHVRMNIAIQRFSTKKFDRSPNGDSGLGKKGSIVDKTAEAGVIIKLEPDFDGNGERFPKRLPPLEASQVQAVLRSLTQKISPLEGEGLRDTTSGNP